MATEPKKALKIFEQSVVFMTRNGIEPTPANYHVMYDYFSESNQEITGEINSRMDAGKNITSDFCEHLYRQHIAGGVDSKAVVDASNQAGKYLQDLSMLLTSISTDNASYSSELSNFSLNLTSDSTGDIKSVISDILEKTRQMQVKSAELNGRLEASNSEISALKTNLEKAKLESSKDFLTSLYNRRAFDESITTMIADAKLEKKPLCLLMLDVDHFKKYNDTYGHQLGDDVLRVVSKVITDALRGADIAARYGGEEFAAVLPNTPLEGAIVVAEKLRKTIASKALRKKSTGEFCGNITISIGISTLSNDDTPDTLIQRADAALYDSKNNGRNRVTSR